MELWKKIWKWLDLKKIAIVTAVLYCVMMLPTFYLSFYARPSGDDYQYAAKTHQAWVQTHSFIATWKAAIAETQWMCTCHNGDWFSVFLFTWMPEVFAPYTFWIPILGMLISTILAYYYLGKEVLVRRLHFEKHEYILIVTLMLLASYQYIPSSRACIYWYVGVIHYIFPHILALLSLTFLSKFEREGKWRYIIFLCITGIMMGGSSYYASFAVFLTMLILLIFRGINNKKLFYLLIPLFFGILSLYFQIAAPGNSARLNEEGGTTEASLAYFFETIFQALKRGVTSGFSIFKANPILLAIVILIGAISWECLLKKKNETFPFKFPGIVIVLVYGIYSSLFCPEIFAGLEISKGPEVIEFLFFWIGLTFICIYIEGWIIERFKLREKQNADERYHQKILPILLLLTFVLMILFRSDIKRSLFYVSNDYIISGQAADFKEQISSQMKILLDDTVKEAYLCPINDQQGPLMHMPVTDDPNVFTNWAVQQFYGKDLVITQD